MYKTNKFYLRFIGENGSMGLRHNHIYQVNVFTMDRFIYVDWGADRCPYISLKTLTENWESV